MSRLLTLLFPMMRVSLEVQGSVPRSVVQIGFIAGTVYCFARVQMLAERWALAYSIHCCLRIWAERLYETGVTYCRQGYGRTNPSSLDCHYTDYGAGETFSTLQIFWIVDSR